MSAPDPAVDEAAARARARRVGLALVLGSAILFSAKAIFVKLSYPYGVDALTLLALRMGMALPVFAALAAVEEHRARAAGNTATARTYGVVAVLGAVGYWLASYLDFAGLAYVTASLERVVLFAYPTFTALLERALFGKKLGRAALVALLLSYAGILLALGGEARVAGANTAIGAGLVLASAAAYACFLVGSGRVVGRYGATRLVAHAMTAACVVVLAHFALSHPLAALAQPPAVLGYAALTAVLSTILPTVLLGHGIRRLGASQAAIAGSVGPVSTLALGAIFLGERITGPQVAGSALVLVGVTWLSVARRLARRWLLLRGGPSRSRSRSRPRSRSRSLSLSLALALARCFPQGACRFGCGLDGQEGAAVRIRSFFRYRIPDRHDGGAGRSVSSTALAGASARAKRVGGVAGPGRAGDGASGTPKSRRKPRTRLPPGVGRAYPLG